MSDWQICTLGDADLDAICVIENDCFSSPWSRDLIAKYLRQERYCCIGLFAGEGSTSNGFTGLDSSEGEYVGQLAGFAIFSWVLDEAELLQIGVASAFRGQGGAKILLGESHNILKAEQIVRIMLEVRGSNAAAIALYKGLDYFEDGRRKGYYPSAEGREDAILMSCNNF